MMDNQLDAVRFGDLTELAREIREDVGQRLDLSRDLQDEEIRAVITQIVFERSKDRYLTLIQKKDIIDKVFNSMRRLDILQPLLEDPSVTEIMINSPTEIFIEQDGQIHQFDLAFESAEKLAQVIQSVVGKVNRSVNEATPIVDARLQDGSRVNVVLPPIALKGPTMTIRKFPEQPLTIEKLVALGSLTDQVGHFLEKLVKARYNLFVSGGTGSGKTTFLNALSDFIPEQERIITIEDSAELQLRRIKNLVTLETRTANTEGKGEITMRDLIKTSLRMRPDRIVVGEVRGVEALDMLQAMNTGHDGSLSTGHANTTRDMISRLETMVLSAAPFPIEVIRKQIAAALDIIIHLGRLRDGSRRVVEICEVVDCVAGEVQLNPLYVLVEEPCFSLQPTGNSLVNTLKLQMAGLK